MLTIVFGLWLWLGYGISGGWLHAKLALVLVLLAYHAWCGKLLARHIECRYGLRVSLRQCQRWLHEHGPA